MQQPFCHPERRRDIKMSYFFRSLLIFISILLLPACSNLSYYFDAANGHMDLLDKAEPIDEILQRPDLDGKFRQQLITFQQARDFASQYLYLPGNDSYRSFSDLGREYVVWNVVATNEFSIKPQKWCFLFVGCLTYRGYFEKHKVDAFADELKQQGQDVYVSGVSAYSTLGWFDDPVVSSMLYNNEARRVGIVFHELAHQLMYRKNSTTFNESFAMVVEEEGIRRWFESRNKQALLEQYKEDKAKSRQFHQMLVQTKNRLNMLYTQDLDDTEKRQKKQRYLQAIKSEYTKLRQQWNGYSGYDKWMSQELNNAHFVLVQTYHDLVPMFKAMLKQKNNDLESFYDEVIVVSELSDDEFAKEILRRKKFISDKIKK
jgi:predicted aminopeptidase